MRKQHAAAYVTRRFMQHASELGSSRTGEGYVANVHRNLTPDMDTVYHDLGANGAL